MGLFQRLLRRHSHARPRDEAFQQRVKELI